MKTIRHYYYINYSYMKKTIEIFILIISLIANISCSDDDNYTEEILTIMPYRELYHPLPFGGATAEGYAAKNAKGESFHIGHIYGFDDQYEEGYHYTIKVKVKFVDGEDGIADALSRYEYYLVEIINKTKDDSD